MLISCPKCRSVYNISADRIPENGKKFKCAECGEIWMVYPSSLADAEAEDMSVEDEISTDNKQDTASGSENAQNTEINEDINEDINIMFNRLSHDTKNLFSSGNSLEGMSVGQKIKHYTLNNISLYLICAFLLIAIVILGAKLFYVYRYDVVSAAPWLENMYERLKVESMYRGKDLVFEDVQIKELEEKGKPLIEVSGRIYNKGDKTVHLLPVKVSVVNRNNQIENEVVEILPEHKVESGFSVLFRVLLDYPSDFNSKLRITMEDVLRDFNE